jgi:hypothetical protein
MSDSLSKEREAEIRGRAMQDGYDNDVPDLLNEIDRLRDMILQANGLVSYLAGTINEEGYEYPAGAEKWEEEIDKEWWVE